MRPLRRRRKGSKPAEMTARERSEQRRAAPRDAPGRQRRKTPGDRFLKARDGVADGLWTARRASADGLRATGDRAGPAFVRFIEWLAALAAVLPRLALRGLRGLVGLVRRVYSSIARGLGRLIAAAGRIFTPERSLALVALAAAALLAASQFADYTGVRIGTPDYAPIGPEAPAPVVETAATGSAHSWALLPAAVIAALAILVAMRGRWQVARVAALVGAAGLAVALLVDRSKGLDEGDAGVKYSGAKATLLGGFYAEIAASAVLLLCGLLLARQLRTSVRSRRKRRRPRPNVSAESAALAGGRG